MLTIFRTNLLFLHQHKPEDISSCGSTDPTCATTAWQRSSTSRCPLKIHKTLWSANPVVVEFPANKSQGQIMTTSIDVANFMVQSFYNKLSN